jgi:hypothetical protein
MYEELIQRLREVADEVDSDYDVDPYNAEQRCLAILQAAEAIEKLEKSIPRWIPVTERLPEKYTAVLAAGNGEVACGLFVGFAEPAHVASWDLDNVAAEPVTHWMPLPEPPKEEE